MGRVVSLEPAQDKSHDYQTSKNSSYHTPINIVILIPVAVVAAGGRFPMTSVAIQTTAMGQRVSCQEGE